MVVETDELRDIWQSQVADRHHFTTEEIRMRIEQMEKSSRRHVYDFYVAFALSSIVILGLGLISSSLMQRIGAVLSVLGGAYVGYQVHQGRSRTSRSAVDGSTASIEFHREMLQRQLDFFRNRVWSRIIALSPGGLLFFTGFAQARPDLAPLIYIQLVTFVAAIVAMVPLSRRNAARYQRELDELDRLQKG